MTSEAYYSDISNRLSFLKTAVKMESASSLNALPVYYDHFFAEFLNTLFDWDLISVNITEKNYPGIGLVDNRRKILVRVLGSNDRQAIQNTLDKLSNRDYPGNRLVFVIISDDIPKYRKLFAVPNDIVFDWKKDIISINLLLEMVAKSPITKQQRLADLCDRYFGHDRKTRFANYQINNNPQIELDFAPEKAKPMKLKVILPVTEDEKDPSNEDEIDPEKTPILFSVCTKKAYDINTDYYKGLHYVWCAPFFTDPAQPPTSNPLTIYNLLEDIILHKDIHENEIKNNKTGLLRGVQSREKEGIITAEERGHIEFDINRDQKKENYYPVIYVIPVHTLADYKKRCIKQAKEDCASETSIEYKITDLKTGEFYLIDLSDSLKRKIK